MSEQEPGSGRFIEISGITKRFGDVVAVNAVDLAIRRGEIFALLGPSGCGKSTLMRIIAGLESPTAGSVRIEGAAVTGLPPYRRPVNLMFQSYALFPHLTVAQNVAFGLRQERLAGSVVRERVARMLELVRMSAFRDRRPDQLSGGQQQRVALARSLAKEPKLLLLDEPMGALDRKLRAEMQFEIAEILRRVRVTCMLVTHDPEEAMVMADRLGLMRDGELVQIGPPADVYEWPESRFAAEFLGPMNFLDGRVAAVSDGTVIVEAGGFEQALTVMASAAPEPGTAVTVAIRPERISCSAEPLAGRPNQARVRVEDAAYLGTHTSCHVRLPGGQILRVRETHRGTSQALGHGMEAFVAWDARDARLLTR